MRIKLFQLRGRERFSRPGNLGHQCLDSALLTRVPGADDHKQRKYGERERARDPQPDARLARRISGWSSVAHAIPFGPSRMGDAGRLSLSEGQGAIQSIIEADAPP